MQRSQLSHEQILVRDENMYPPRRAEAAIAKLLASDNNEELLHATGMQTGLYVMNFALYAAKPGCTEDQLKAATAIIAQKVRIHGHHQILHCLRSDNEMIARGVMKILLTCDSEYVLNVHSMDFIELFVCKSMELHPRISDLHLQFLKNHGLQNRMTLLRAVELLDDEETGAAAKEYLKSLKGVEIGWQNSTSPNFISRFKNYVMKNIQISNAELILGETDFFRSPMPDEELRDKFDRLWDGIDNPALVATLCKWAYLDGFSADQQNYPIFVASLSKSKHYSEFTQNKLLTHDDVDVVRGAIEIVVQMGCSNIIPQPKCEQLLSSAIPSLAARDQGLKLFCGSAVNRLGPSSFSNRFAWRYIGPLLLSNEEECVETAKWYLEEIDPQSVKMLGISPQVLLEGESPTRIDDKTKRQIAEKIKSAL